VCKVYDLHSAQTRRGEVEFLLMEFIKGENLRARLGRTGSPFNDAWDIALQVSAGLGPLRGGSGHPR
jgi:hypothetical protein